MAFIQPIMATNNITALDPEPNDVQGLTDAQLQAKFDQFSVDFKAYFITHLAELASFATGTSGSENTGSATIAGLTGNTVYAQIANMLLVAQEAQAGTILPGVVSDTMLSNAAGQIKDIVTTHLADYMPHQSGLNSYATAVDANGIYTILSFKRSDATLYMKSTLSGGTSPSYTTDTWQFYDALGTTIVLTKTWTITYDASGKITSKAVA